jgi:hypothetical protein
MHDTPASAAYTGETSSRATMRCLHAVHVWQGLDRVSLHFGPVRRRLKLENMAE